MLIDKSIMIGDQKSDQEAGIAAGCLKLSYKPTKTLDWLYANK